MTQLAKEIIARRVAREIPPGGLVNLGIGLPTLVGKYIQKNVILHAENGVVLYGPPPEAGKEDDDFINASGKYVTLRPGAACFDSAISFSIIRGGHLDAHDNCAAWVGDASVDVARDGLAQRNPAKGYQREG